MQNPERRARELITKAGLELRSIVQAGSKHYRAVVAAPDGRTTKVFFCSTPSDWRGDRNKLAELRRFLNGTEQRAHTRA